MRPAGFRGALFLLAAALASACAGEAPAPPGPRLLLVTLDTTRADHLSPYGYSRDTAPELAALARGGVLFRRAYASMPTTDPSHATFLTGAYPRRHGVTRNGLRAADGLPSLAARLRAGGVRTAAFISRKHLDPRELNIPGFGRIDVSKEKERRADDTAGAAIRWLESQEDGAFFAWVHLFDPHSPYDPPAPFDTVFGAGPPEKRLGKMGWLEPGVRHPAETLARNVALYDGEIAWTDRWLGRLVRAVEALPGEPPLIVVAGDHGESLGDLEERAAYAFAHGEFLYDHQVRIPLVMRRKGRLPEGRVAEGLFDAVDLAPTVLDLLGDADPLGGDGASRASLALGASEEGAPAVFIQRRSFAEPEQPWLAADEFAVVEGTHKLIVNRLKGDELYDLAADPREATNLAASDPARVAALKERLLAWLRAHPAAAEGADPDEEKLKDLRSLGYVN